MAERRVLSEEEFNGSLSKEVPDYLSIVEEKMRQKRREEGDEKEDGACSESLKSAYQQVMQIISRPDVDEDIKREIVVKFSKDFPNNPCFSRPELVKYLSNLTLMLGVSGPDSGLGIYVNGLYSGKRTPASIKVVRGDIIRPGKIGWGGIWIVRGDEEHIRFRGVAGSEGVRLYVDIVGEQKTVVNMIGYSLKENTTQEEFDRIVTSSGTMRIISLSDCWNIRSIHSLLGQTDLWALDLAKTRITDMGVLAGFKSLRLLNLRGTHISDISPIAELKELRFLSLWETPVSDIAPLVELKELRVVNLISTFVSDISPLLNLKNLKVIYLTGSKFTVTQNGLESDNL